MCVSLHTTIFLPLRLHDNAADGMQVASSLWRCWLAIGWMQGIRTRKDRGPLFCNPIKNSLTLFDASSPNYRDSALSAVGCHMLVEYWLKRSNLGPVSKEIALRCHYPTEVESHWKLSLKKHGT